MLCSLPEEIICKFSNVSPMLSGKLSGHRGWGKQETLRAFLTWSPQLRPTYC